MKLVKYLGVVVLSAVLAACGGGGGSAGATGGGTGTGGTGGTGGTANPTSSVTDFSVFMDRSTLNNAGTETAKLTVIAVDSKNNVVSGATVTVATDGNSIYVPGSTVTDSAGQYTGSIRSGSNKADRQIIATVTVNGIVKQTSLQIVGSQIDLGVSPAVLAPGVSGTVNVRLSDSASQPVANTVVTLAGDIPALVGRRLTTDSNGRVSVAFTAPTTVGSYVISAAGNGVSTQVSVQVGTGAVIPAGVIPVGAAPSLAASPDVLAPNTAGSTSNQAQLRFLLLDAQNNPVPNVRVRFQMASAGLGSVDSTISTGASTVYTNASGVATAAFIPGQTGSPTNGVTIRACYQATDFTSATQCGSFVEVGLTIAAQALAVSIGNDNLLAKGAGTYIKQFVVTVADSAGRAVANAPVDISLDITHYAKGTFDQTPSFSLSTGDIRSYNPDEQTTPAAFGLRVSCINEDRNRNGFVDPGDNTNNSVDSFGQQTLEPRRSDMILSYADPAVRTTNANGILLIKVEYSQRFATWLAYRIKATTNVSGSQGISERAFITGFVDGDETNGSFLSAPYGTSACNSPN